MITVVVTSCGRIDLLKKTITSFNKYNTFPINQMIVIDDSGNDVVQGEIARWLFDISLQTRYVIRFVQNHQNIGQVNSIDKAYSMITTPYVFHCEEDWEFYRHGFIEKSLDVLEADGKILCVWLRAIGDTNGHPLEDGVNYTNSGVGYRLLGINYQGIWHGYTWNPGLRRMCDYDIVKPFVQFDTGNGAAVTECHVGQKYFELGFRGAILPEGYVKHIGYGESTRG